MNTLVKILTGILGVLAVIACIATIGIIGYSMLEVDSDEVETVEESQSTPTAAEMEEVAEEVPSEEVHTAIPESVVPEGFDPDHIHDYTETVERKATCYRAGQLKYICSCGDYYYVDLSSTGHVEDEWELEKEATKEHDGLRVKRCIYCDEIVAQEVILYKAEENNPEDEKHVHQYAGRVEREPGCVLAGLRKYSCTCGSFYTEKISAIGHIASDWEVAEEPTTTTLGREQRICNVCGVVLDSRPVNALKASPSASVSASPSATASAAASPTASASATPSATPHSHNYTSYVLKEATCSEKGIRSFVCTCGSSYAEVIDLDSQNHSFKAVVTPPTSNSSGFTTYTCVWCDFNYVDNYISPTG